MNISRNGGGTGKAISNLISIKGGTSYRAGFTPAGDWIETGRSIEKDDLPHAIRKQLIKNYGDYMIVEIEGGPPNQGLVL